MKKHIDLIWEYNDWANRRILARAASLTQAQLSEQLPTMWASILGTMAHVLGAEWIWRQRTQAGISPAALLDRDQFTTLDLLNQRWAEEAAAMRAYLATLSDADLDRVVEYHGTIPTDQPFRRPLWQILTHVVNHGTQPLDDLYFALKPRSRNLGEVDYPALMAGRPQATSTNPAGGFALFRIGDAVSARNTHAAIYDALRLVKDI